VRAMCEREGWTWLEGQKNYAWFGRFVGDYPMPKGWTEEDLGKCEHAIKIPGINYEIGICKAKDGDGFRFMFDFYDNKLKALAGTNGNILKQLYAVEKAKMEAKKRGYRVTERKKGKKIYLTVEGKR